LPGHAARIEGRHLESPHLHRQVRPAVTLGEPTTAFGELAAEAAASACRVDQMQHCICVSETRAVLEHALFRELHRASDCGAWPAGRTPVRRSTEQATRSESTSAFIGLLALPALA
jgi:hypothetical protein